MDTIQGVVSVKEANPSDAKGAPLKNNDMSAMAEYAAKQPLGAAMRGLQQTVEQAMAPQDAVSAQVRESGAMAVEEDFWGVRKTVLKKADK